MLTNIEWWGGLVLIWLSLCFYFFLVAFKEQKHSVIETVSTYVAFFCAAIVFSLYFYPLESLLVKQVYLGLLILGALMTVLTFVWPEPEKTDDDESDEEEEGPILVIIVQILIILPFVICFAAAAYKIKDSLSLLL